MKNEEPPAPPASVVRMNDPKVAAQLLNGFYGIETASFRWTAGKFSVLLATPPAASQNGATLTFSFAVAGLSIQKLGNFGLSASIGGQRVGSMSYDKPGAAVFKADIPAALLKGDSVKVDFALDKALPPGSAGADARELGLVAYSVALESK